jgi:hypothetical protein
MEVDVSTPQDAGRRNAGRSRLRALEAQRLIDLLALRVAPSVAAGLIAYSHMGHVGEGLIVFAAMLATTQLVDSARFPLGLMTAARIVVALAAPVLGGAIAWLIMSAAGDPYPVSQYEAVVLGAWLVIALGAWIKMRLSDGMRARVAVIGPRDFAADLAAEIAASGVRAYEVVG